MSNPSITKNQLKWQCRRGMLELDLVFNKFLDTQYDTLTVAQQVQFKQLLDEVDPDIYAWLFCDAAAPAELQELVQYLIAWRKNGT